MLFMMKFVKLEINEDDHFDPIGMTNDIESAHSPHSILYAWNNEIQIARPINQRNAPIADNITSIERGSKVVTY